jgi:predicted transposase/invertase (TIGR01784 family)
MSNLLSPKSDYVFKLIFGDQKNVDILGAFLSAVLDLPRDEFEDITIIDPHLRKESDNDKLGILDVKILTKTGAVINVEIQVCPVLGIDSRILYYASKMLTEQLASGESYAEIKRVISILITDYNMFNGKGYHHLFRLRDEGGLEFSNMLEINTLELPRVPDSGDGTELWDWMSFIKAESKEVLEMLAERSAPMKKAIGRLKELSDDERTRLISEARDKARRDEQARMAWALQEGKIEVARKMLKMDMPIEDISKFTDIPIEKVREL